MEEFESGNVIGKNDGQIHRTEAILFKLYDDTFQRGITEVWIEIVLHTNK